MEVGLQRNFNRIVPIGNKWRHHISCFCNICAGTNKTDEKIEAKRPPQRFPKHWAACYDFRAPPIPIGITEDQTIHVALALMAVPEPRAPMPCALG